MWLDCSISIVSNKILLLKSSRWFHSFAHRILNPFAYDIKYNFCLLGID